VSSPCEEISVEAVSSPCEISVEAVNSPCEISVETVSSPHEEISFEEVKAAFKKMKNNN